MHKVPVFGRLAHTFRHEHTRSRTPPETVMDGTGKEALLWLDAGFWFCWRDCCDRDRHCHGVDTLAFRRAGKCQATSARTATETAGRQSDALPLKRSFLSVQTCKLSSRKAQWSRVMWPNWTVCLRVFLRAGRPLKIVNRCRCEGIPNYVFFKCQEDLVQC